MPAIRPPPPTSTKTASKGSPCWRTISIPTVPCPAMTCSSSNGGMKTIPRSAASTSARSFAPSYDSPASTTSAPSRSTASTLMRGAVSGMTMRARIPSRSAASATPCAWLPAEDAMTPRARSSADSDASLL